MRCCTVGLGEAGYGGRREGGAYSAPVRVLLLWPVAVAKPA